MAELGQGRAQGLVKLDLARCVIDVVVASNDMGDAHGYVVHHHGHVVGGHAVATQNDQVVQFGVVKGDGAFYQIGPMGCSALGPLKRTTAPSAGPKFFSRQRPSYLGFRPSAMACSRRAVNSSGVQWHQ